MNAMKCLIVLLLTASVCCGTAFAADLRVTEMAVTTKIVRGKPIDSVHRISSASVKELICFTRITSPGEETSIKHIWYRNNTQMAEYELPVKGKRWRTYSRKTVEKGSSAGEWRVDAVDSDGTVLKSVSFRMN